MHGVPEDQLYAQDKSQIDINVNPMVYVNLPSVDVCRQIVSRSILIKEIIDVFAEAVVTPLE